MSHSEKVGSLFNLLLGLQNQTVREIFDQAHERQKKKYETFPSQSQLANNNVSHSKSNKSKKKSQRVTNKRRRVTNKRRCTADSSSNSSDDEDTDEDTDEDKGDSPALPASAFPFSKDLHFGYDFRSETSFDREDYLQ